MGFFTRLLGLKQEDEEEGGARGGEGERSIRLNLQNHNNHGERRLPRLFVLGISIYKAVKGLLRKVGSIFHHAKPAHPLLPLQNPATTQPLLLPAPTISSSPTYAFSDDDDDDHRVLWFQEENYRAETDHHVACASTSDEMARAAVFVEECDWRYFPLMEETTEDEGEGESKLLESGTEMGYSNAVISEEIVEEREEERTKHYCIDDEEGHPHIPCRQESPEENYSALEIRGSNAFISVSHHEIVEETAPENPPCLEEREEEREEGVVKVQVKVKSTTNIVEEDEERRIKHYSSRHKILLVGEGDFSFSASLAAAFGSAANIVATSLDSESFLKKNYGKALSNISELKRRGAKVMHGIDATQIANHESLCQLKFDRIIYNFPFAGFFTNLSTAAQLRRHRRLVSLFLRNAKEMMSEDGEIHISHKTNGYFHAQFKVESIASSHGLRLIEAVQFERSDYPGYNTKYGFGGDDNFNCVPSNTLKFAL